MMKFRFVYLAFIAIIMGCASTGKLPSEPDALFKLGKEALKKGKYDLAASAFEKFTITYPTDPRAPEAQFLLAESYFKEKDWNNAISEYKFLLDNYPRNEFREAAYFHMATAYLKKSPPPYLDQTETEEAMGMLRNFLATYPNSTYAKEARQLLEEAKDKLAKHMLIAADTYIKLEKFEAAKLFLEELIKRYPGVPTAMKAKVILAEVLIKLGERDKALLTLNEIIDMPDVPDSLKQTAFTLKKTLQ